MRRPRRNPTAARLHLPGRSHGLGHAAGTGVARVEHAADRLWHRSLNEIREYRWRSATGFPPPQEIHLRNAEICLN